MTKERIYILHKNGANRHYTGLKEFLSQNEMELKYYEFSIASKLYKSLVKGQAKFFLKQLRNIWFFVFLFFSKNKKVVLGIAPFDARLIRVLFFLRNHQLYYHSSWTCWDKTFHPNKKKNKQKVFDAWTVFLEEKVKHHFVVTEQTKNELLTNYNIKTSKITVVNHSLNPAFLNLKSKGNRAENSFIYLGRLVPQKGIEELLSFFKKRPDCVLTILGGGKLEGLVSETASEYDNIIYKGYERNIENLIKEIQLNEFMVVNSKKTNKWEELFGLVIIETMSQGVIPIASNHSGPKEIITNDTGYLFEEGDLNKCLSEVISNGGFCQEKSDNCIVDSHKYSPKKIALRWKPILD